MVMLTVEDGCQREYTVLDKTSPLYGLWLIYRPCGPIRTREYLYTPHADSAGWVRKTAQLIAERVIEWNIADPTNPGAPLPITVDAIAGPAASGDILPVSKNAVEYHALEFLINLITGYVGSPEAMEERKN